MQPDNGRLVFVRPGDLHLTEPDLANHQVARWMITEVNTLIRPDFVQFAGDNVQNALDAEFELFRGLAKTLAVPWHAMVGDHDICGDVGAEHYQRYLGSPYRSFELNGFRIIRLNTTEAVPLGLSLKQTNWLAEELANAKSRQQRVVLFQHHYPFKVCEDFRGPGIERWRSLLAQYEVEAVFCGHTHYGQIANDGQRLAIATRSIGDPEGGAPGYHLVYMRGEDLAMVYRCVEDHGPVVMITHPRARLLATRASHIVSTAALELEVLIWVKGETREVAATIDGEPCPALVMQDKSQTPAGQAQRWSTTVTRPWAKGTHSVSVDAVDVHGQRGSDRLEFHFDATGRFTPVPRAEPQVDTTAYC